LATPNGTGEAAFLAGEYSIADIGTFTWVNFAISTIRGNAGSELEATPAIDRWPREISSRPAVQGGLRAPKIVIAEASRPPRVKHALVRAAWFDPTWMVDLLRDVGCAATRGDRHFAQCTASDLGVTENGTEKGSSPGNQFHNHPSVAIHQAQLSTPQVNGEEWKTVPGARRTGRWNART
jgi:hypothetical protein